MTPERRAAIIEAFLEDQRLYLLGMGESDPDLSDYRAGITEEEIEAYDKWLREFPA